jgi:hypothetical protein
MLVKMSVLVFCVVLPCELTVRYQDIMSQHQLVKNSKYLYSTTYSILDHCS